LNLKHTRFIVPTIQSPHAIKAGMTIIPRKKHHTVDLSRQQTEQKIKVWNLLGITTRFFFIPPQKNGRYLKNVGREYSNPLDLLDRFPTMKSSYARESILFGFLS